ncbi:MAG: tRNA uridine-5-carboxymethylaminomethyl(34) synthesis enzyme MnmG [Firmicutes bacterium]|nr:tRNA uridine-5-carboxymethylaminomethyl(34) synthesis enzyme MnmG [Bacillota bacterium]
MGGKYDVIVVGAGHAGCEAALAAARMGARTLLLTLSLEHIALMPCNPSIGGPAKGHLVREIDALGGQMARNTDRSYLQLRLLNTSKGPAVRALRAICDKDLYRRRMRQTLWQTEGLAIKEAAVAELLLKGNKIQGVHTQTGVAYSAPAVVLTTGVYLNSEIFIGELKYKGGPQGQPAVRELSQFLLDLGFTTGRFRTTTPPRIAAHTVDYSRLTPQLGSEEPLCFSFWSVPRRRRQLPCWLTSTNERAHEIIMSNIGRSPFSVNKIEGAEPRYCPSIEGKVMNFRERTGHQIFLEPEGWDSQEVYVMGLFTSLPEEVQLQVLRSLPGLEKVEIIRPGYGIEYDYLPPSGLKANLETKLVQGLFCAGQVNGTSGYEEAAAQGLMAGINAVLSVRGEEPFILGRHEAYIGVLIDDLVTKGTRDPYRMLTSRAEYRLLLRMDNADLRLCDYGYKLGLLPEKEYQSFCAKREEIERERERLESVRLSPRHEVNEALVDLGSVPLDRPLSLAELLRRPELSYDDIKRLSAPEKPISAAAAEEVEIELKYAGYIQKEKQLVQQMQRLEGRLLPPDFDYQAIQSLSAEAREKLGRVRPRTVGQAARIPGVSPADVAVLLVQLRAREKGGKRDDKKSRA